MCGKSCNSKSICSQQENENVSISGGRSKENDKLFMETWEVRLASESWDVRKMVYETDLC